MCRLLLLIATPLATANAGFGIHVLLHILCPAAHAQKEEIEEDYERECLDIKKQSEVQSSHSTLIYLEVYRSLAYFSKYSRPSVDQAVF